MLTWTLTTSLFLPTSSMQSIPTSRILAISLVGLPLLSRPYFNSKLIFVLLKILHCVDSWNIQLCAYGRNL